MRPLGSTRRPFRMVSANAIRVSLMADSATLLWSYTLWMVPLANRQLLRSVVLSKRAQSMSLERREHDRARSRLRRAHRGLAPEDGGVAAGRRRLADGGRAVLAQRGHQQRRRRPRERHRAAAWFGPRACRQL